MLSTVFAPLAAHPVELYPQPLRDDIDALNGASTTGQRRGLQAGSPHQELRQGRRLFQTLDELDLRLADRRFLFGPSR